MNGFDSSFDVRPRGPAPTALPSVGPFVQPELSHSLAPPVPEEVQTTPPDFERFRTIAIATALSHVLGTAPATTLFQRAILNHNLHEPHQLGPSLRAHADEFKRFHREESFPFIVGSGLLDLFEGAVSGALLGVLVELTKVGLAISVLDDESYDLPHEALRLGAAAAGSPAPPAPSLAKRMKHGLYMALGNAACFGVTAAACLWLHTATFQVRHHAWRGWNGLFPLRWRALPTLSVEYQCLQLCNRHLRRAVYDLLGRPFSVPLAAIRQMERAARAERRRLKGKEKLPDDDDDDGDDKDGDEDGDEAESHHNGGAKVDGGRALQRRRDEEREGEEEAEVMGAGDLARELVRKAGFQVMTRGISLAVTLALSAVHVPLSTITHTLLAAPVGAYTGPLDCAQQIVAAEGWHGLYKGLFWHVLCASDVLLLHDVWSGAELSLVD